MTSPLRMIPLTALCAELIKRGVADPPSYRTLWFMACNGELPGACREGDRGRWLVPEQEMPRVVAAVRAPAPKPAIGRPRRRNAGAADGAVAA